MNGDKPNVEGIVLAGSAHFKTVIRESDMLDKKIKDLLLASFDISYGG